MGYHECLGWARFLDITDADFERLLTWIADGDQIVPDRIVPRPARLRKAWDLACASGQYGKAAQRCEAWCQKYWGCDWVSGTYFDRAEHELTFDCYGGSGYKLADKIQQVTGWAMEFSMRVCGTSEFYTETTIPGTFFTAGKKITEEYDSQAYMLDYIGWQLQKEPMCLRDLLRDSKDAAVISKLTVFDSSVPEDALMQWCKDSGDTSTLTGCGLAEHLVGAFGRDPGGQWQSLIIPGPLGCMVVDAVPAGTSDGHLALILGEHKDVAQPETLQRCVHCGCTFWYTDPHGDRMCRNCHEWISNEDEQPIKRRRQCPLCGNRYWFCGIGSTTKSEEVSGYYCSNCFRFEKRRDRYGQNEGTASGLRSAHHEGAHGDH